MLSGLYFIGLIFTQDDGILVVIVFFAICIYASIISTYIISKGAPELHPELSHLKSFLKVKEGLKEKSISDLGLERAIKRGTKWLLSAQRRDGLWKQKNPLYETSEILETLHNEGSGLKLSWKRTFDGNPEVRNVEQIYYILLDELSVTNFAVDFENVYPRKVTGSLSLSIDKTNVNDVAEAEKLFKSIVALDDDTYEELKRNLHLTSPWDFISQLEATQREGEKIEPPYFLALGAFAMLRHEVEVAQHVADVFSETFNIIISRAKSRFNLRGEDTELPSFILGMMYNALTEIVKVNKQVLTKKDMMVSSERTVSTEDSEFLDDASDLSLDLPGIDFEKQTLSPFYDAQEDTNRYDKASENERVAIDARLSRIRRYIRDKQQVDGSWDGGVFATIECLKAISHNEIVEDDDIKFALKYLLVSQDSNGSWENDYVTTARALRTLQTILNNVVIKL